MRTSQGSQERLQPEKDAPNTLEVLMQALDYWFSVLSRVPPFGAALDERWLALYHAAWLLLIAGRCFRNLRFKSWPPVPRLLDAAIVILDRHR